MAKDTQFPSGNRKQADRVKRVFASFVVSAVEEAAEDEKMNGTGAAAIADWARSKEGHEILCKAGVTPCPDCIAALRELVALSAQTGPSWSRRQVFSHLRRAQTDHPHDHLPAALGMRHEAPRAA
ncbi:DUF6280 family protein [Pseudaestuariivita sp.]|uniref:DUF6280 family protein n=1 Tax=Pseudaestuariivita sp. TaxID=2211669 RepID=UPI0040586C43